MFGLVAMMFSLGLTLGVAEFKRIAEKPRAVLCGLLGQLIVLPLLAISLALMLSLPDFVAMGLVVLAACPGGATSNAFSALSNGDIALSVTLTALTSVIAFATVPLVINAGFAVISTTGADVQLPFVEAAIRIALTTLLPVGVGMFVRSRREGGFPQLQQIAFYTAFAALIIPGIALVWQNGQVMMDALLGGAPTGILLNLMATAAGFGLALLFRLPTQQQRTIALEVGIQNFGLALVIMMTFLQDTRLLAVGLFYLPSMLLVGGLMATFSKRIVPTPHDKGRKEETVV